MAIKYRETYSNDSEVKTIDQGSMEIIADDGGVLYTIDLKPDGDLFVHVSSAVEQGGEKLATQLSVTPLGANWLKINRTEYK